MPCVYLVRRWNCGLLLVFEQAFCSSAEPRFALAVRFSGIHWDGVFRRCTMVRKTYCDITKEFRESVMHYICS